MKIMRGIFLLFMFLSVSPLLSAASAKKNETAGGIASAKERGAVVVQRLTKILGLTDEQAAKMREARTAYEASTKPLRDKVFEDRDKLEALVKKRASTDELTPAISQLKKDQALLDAEIARRKDEMQAILTPAQQAKFLLRMLDRDKISIDSFRKAQR
jgi:Spy/CpxP family protein refolding chaperone